MFSYSGVETLATSCSPFTARGMTVSCHGALFYTRSQRTNLFKGDRALDFTCCDIEPAILGTLFTSPLHENRAGVLTFHSKERTSPHDDRRQSIIYRHREQIVEHILSHLSG